MEKAVLKTLIYADIFDFPLTIFEIHKWLIGEKAQLRQVEKALERLRVKGKAKSLPAGKAGVKGYYFLPEKDSLVEKRQRNKLVVKKYLQRAKLVANILRLIPWIKLVGISGGLAMENVSERDDIDLFIITDRNRIWLSRLLSIIFLNIFRRRVSDKKNEVGGKICLNLILDTDHLEQDKKNIYTAHEVLQMRVIWERDGCYNAFLSKNEWVFKFLPNWITRSNVQGKMYNVNSRFNFIENLAKKFQLWYMQPPKGLERIEDGALYFHPKDYSQSVNESFKTAIDKHLKVS